MNTDMIRNSSDSLQLCPMNEYDVLRRIFNFLSLKDLITCSKVCVEWKKVVNTTIKKRRTIQALLFENDHEEPFILSDASLTLVFYNARGTDESSRLHLTDNIIQIFSHCGIIYLQNGKKHSSRLQRFAPLKRYTSVLRFPPHDKVIVKTFNIDVGQILTVEEMEARIDLPSDVPIKAIIILVYNHDECPSEVVPNGRILQKCMSSREPCAVGGCWVAIDTFLPTLVGMSVTIFAGEKVEAGSCVLDNSHRTLFAINSKIEDFSKNVTQTKNSVMMIFRCHSRIKVRKRYNYTPAENVETWEYNAVLKYFSPTPLFGCYGNGEFGHDYPSQETGLKKRRQTFSSMQHSFSTVLLYIGYQKN